MSGGEQQRVAIARAIAKRPEMLLCDDPTGALLDALTGRVILRALDKVNRELGTTTIVITHNSEIGRLADRVITLSDGNIAEIRANSSRQAVSEVHW